MSANLRIIAAVLLVATPGLGRSMGLPPPPPPPPAPLTVQALPSLSQPRFFPSWVALDASGNAYVTDPRAGAVVVLDPQGALVRRIQVGGTPSGVAVSRTGQLFVAELDGGRVESFDLYGGHTRSLGAGAGELAAPAGVAVHPGTGRVWVADAGAACVRVFEADGAAVATFPLPGRTPSGVAFDAAGARAYVTDGTNGQLLVLDQAGAVLQVFGSFNAPLTRPAGVAVGADGSVFVVDAYSAQAVVFTSAGAVRGAFGTYGSAPGQLQIPIAIAIDGRGRALVTNTQLGRVEAFAIDGGQACPGDSDCDGMPDAWELAHGLNPYDPSDAALDLDGDGLTNLQEYQHGTDPRLADSDGDGVPDGVEVAAGLDPTKADRPALVTASTRETDPGLVRISASLVSPIPCTVSWRRVGGLDVPLRTSTGLAPTFVGRAAGVVELEGIATCGPVQSLPAAVAVTVRNVPPRPDAGRLVVTSGGGSVVLDGGFTRDGNGDSFTLEWAQTLGAPLSGGGTGSLLPVRLGRTGLFAFQLSAADDKGGRADAEVAILRVSSDSPTPTAAAATPVLARVGERVALDGSASLPLGDPFAWQQVEGTPVSLEGASDPLASFTPSEPGRYAFTLTLGKTSLSPPARVDVAVIAAGAAAAHAEIAAPSPATVGEPVALDGSGSTGGAGLRHRWRQVSGPAAGLTDADVAIATVVPFEPGSFVFELDVSDDAGPGLPARARVDAALAGGALPVAVAAAPAAAPRHDAVRLDGTGSRDPAGHALAFRWTQVSGPWVALDDPASAAPTFRPPENGTYVFELEVSDGWTRSAPASVSIAVPAAAVGVGR